MVPALDVIINQWLPHIIAESIAVPLAAQLATTPLVAAISGRVSISGLAANALAGPFVGPATVLGFAAAGVSLLNVTLAAVCGFGAAWCAQMIIWIARIGFPIAWLRMAPAGDAADPDLAGHQLGDALVSSWPICWRDHGWSCCLSGIMIICLCGTPHQPGWPPRDWVLVVCDVGQGDGIVVRTARDSAVVVDTGPAPAAMRGCLDRLDVTGYRC